MDIITLGSGGRLMECASVLSHTTCDGPIRIIILPVPSFIDGKVKGTDISPEELCELVLDGALVAGYGIPEEICAEIHTRGGSIYDASLDEAFLEENAVITAEGVLGTLMCLGDRRLSDMKIGIIGYGRIGRNLTRQLLFFGSFVRVFTGRDDIRRSLGEISVDSASYLDMELSDLDVLINTAPECLIGSDEKLPERLAIFDLASGNYLKNIRRVTKMPSIPEKMYPRSAGKLYAEYIIKHL